MLIDRSGHDRFTAARFAQGAAAFGLGLLENGGEEGDHYLLDMLGQGLGRTKGYGLLHDMGGDDRYVTTGKHDSYYSQWAPGRKLTWSFAQGCGFGFFCRYEEKVGEQDGLVVREMLPGGVGALFDESGDDTYRGSMYAQGTGYFYGLGVLVDRAGNDTYTASWYGQAAAAHYAAGLLVDVSGDDVYLGFRQVQGNARDFSTAVFLDLAGNDRYSGESRLQGCGDVNDAWGIFADAAGDDRYEATQSSARGFATTALSDAEKTDDESADGSPWLDFGIFLDLGGTDTYVGPAGGADNTTWRQKSTGRGIGVDR
jgi:hypothetical protein